MLFLQVKLDQAQDEMSAYFRRETTPKVLLTTCDRPGPVRIIRISLLPQTKVHGFLSWIVSVSHIKQFQIHILVHL